MKKSKNDIFWAFFAANLIAVIICGFLLITESVAFSFNGFAVDSQDQLYVGRGHSIDVIENGEIVQAITTCTSRSFAFTILNGDTILLSTGSKVCTTDTSGANIIEQWDDTNSKTYHELNQNKFEFHSANGETYTASRRWGLLKIYRGSEQIYQMPIFDYIVMLITAISVPLFVISIFGVRKELKKRF